MWKDYFSFNKRQRNGIIVLLTFIMGMMVYLVIADYFPPTAVQQDFKSFKAETDKAKGADTVKPAAKQITPTNVGIIELNGADSAELMKLPGITGKIANTIIHFRDALGGYYSKEQLREVYGMDSAEYVAISSMVSADASKVEKLDINSATEKDMTHHPYIHKKLAKAIYEYRKENGSFNSLDELKKVDGVDAEKFSKIRPYLMISN